MGFKTFFSVVDRILILSIEGQILEESTLNDLVSVVETKLQHTQGNIVLDLSKLKYINSSGINFFIKIHKKTLAYDKQLFIARANSSVVNVLTIAKMNQIFMLVPTIDEAVTHMNNSVDTFLK